MEELVIFQRRNRLKKHFVNTSNVLLYGYQSLSDGAKITYQVIDGFDWESKATGDSKGFVYPSIEKLAQIRAAGKRTVFRHIQELEKASLLTRVRRKYKPSVLYIEEVSETEAKRYLDSFVDKEKQGNNLRNAKNGTSTEHREMPKMSFLYMKKENEGLKENEINVNDNFKTFKERKNGGTVALRDILMQYGLKRTAKLKKPDKVIQRDYLADELADKLSDRKSLGCYRVIADKIPQPVIFEVLGSVRETANAGKIRESRGALFVEIIKKYAESKGIVLGFKTV